MRNLRLGDVCDIVMGQAPSGETYNSTGLGLPLLAGAGDFGPITPQPLRYTTAPNKKTNIGDIILCVRATIGDLNWADREYCLGRGVAGIRAKNEISCPHYLWWILHSKSDIFKSLGRGATFKQINRADIEGLEVNIPSLSEQRRIAVILDQADDLRYKRRKALGNLDHLRQSLFEDTFGDPITNTKNFTSTTLGQLGVKMRYGPRFYNESYSDGGTKIVRITDLSDSGDLDFDAMPKLAVPQRELLEHRSIPGEILFARTGATVGKAALISSDMPTCIPGAYFIRMQFPDSVDPTYAWNAMRSGPIQAIIAEKSRQSAQQNFSGPGLRRLPFLLPPLELQRTFGARVAEIDKLKVQHRAHLAKLDMLFASLQHRAFRGEL